MKQIIVLLLILISVPSFGQYEKLFSDKNIAPYNLALKDKFFWKDSLVHRDSLTYADIAADSIRFRYFDGSYTDWLKFDLNYFTNADETDPVYAGDSANIVWFDDLDYFTNADETDPTVSDLVKGITAADTTWWGTQNNIWTENGDDIYYNDGNVGINTSTPSQKLDVAGKIALNGTVIAYRPTAFAGTLVLGDGGTNLSNTTGAEGYYNTFVGIGAGQANTTGSYNTANGYQSLYSDTTGSYNTANGYQSLYSNTTGVRNTANGMYSLRYNTTGVRNTANGYLSLYANTEGSYNTANGMYSLRSNTEGSYNTANGYQSLYSNTTGGYNTANGYQAGRYIADGGANETGSNSVFLGYDTRANADGETNQIVIGSEAVGNGSNTVTLGNTSITDVFTSGTFTGTNFILSSDRRLKKNIEPIESYSGLGWVDKIDFQQFRMKADDEFLRFGVIAQELEKINPELVRKDDKGIYSVAYIDLIIATLQSQREKIINIEKTISNLIKRIEKLEDEK